MSLISYVTFSITRTSFPEGNICRIDYNYHLSFDRFAYATSEKFEVSCEVFGHHLLHDEGLGDHVYDTHTVTRQDPLPISRTFLIPCEILNERIGRDAIYLRVSARGANGETFSALSQTVRDSF